jgi:hypothetical protein
MTSYFVYKATDSLTTLYNTFSWVVFNTKFYMAVKRDLSY